MDAQIGAWPGWWVPLVFAWDGRRCETASAAVSGVCVCSGSRTESTARVWSAGTVKQGVTMPRRAPATMRIEWPCV